MQISCEATNVRNESQPEQGSSSCLPEKQELLVPLGICIQLRFPKSFAPQANPGDGQMIARIQPLLFDGILAARHRAPGISSSRGRGRRTAAEGMIDLHWTDGPGAARCKLWTWCAAAIIAATRRYPEGRQALPGRESSVDAARVTPNASIWRILQGAHP